MSTGHDKKDSVLLPAPTAWPLVLAVGIALVAAGVVLSIGFLIAGGVVFAIGLCGWIGELRTGHGHVHEPFVPIEQQPAPTVARPGAVEPLVAGAPGFRFRLPTHVQPVSSGAKGGLVGAVAMTVPAVLYGVLNEGSPWPPINLLAGTVIPSITEASMESLRQFQPVPFLVATVIHLAFSVTFGLMYGVLLPMLPKFKGSPLVHGGVVMPIIWSGVCYGLMGVVNPALKEHVNWPWFILSQFVYGLAMSWVVFRSEEVAVSQAPPLRTKR
jgi:hypothetical protein